MELTKSGISDRLMTICADVLSGRDNTHLIKVVSDQEHDGVNTQNAVGSPTDEAADTEISSEFRDANIQTKNLKFCLLTEWTRSHPSAS